MVIDIDKKLELIKRNTAEIVGDEKIAEILKKRDLKVYIGSETSGRPHVGYFVWMRKVADLLNAGCEVQILLADLHAHLNDMKSPFELLDKRVKYYSEVFKLALQSMGADIKKLKFVKGSDFQLASDYCLDVFKMASLVSLHDTGKAISEVVRESKNPKLGGHLYPILQALDEQYLGVDMQMGGLDQRKILVFAREYLPKLGYEPRIEFMTPMIPGLTGGKMSSSVEGSKIDLLDDAKSVEAKVNKAYCLEGDLDNGLLPFLKYVIMVVLGDKGESFKIERPEKFGGNVGYDDYESLEKDFVDKKLHPMDLKIAFARELNKLMDPIRKEKVKLDKLVKEAYK